MTAGLFGALFFTKWIPVLAYAGLLVLAATAVLLTGTTGGNTTVIVIGTAGVGLGVGASVAPGLFVAGFTMPSQQLQRIFALVEMLRGIGAFLTAPILLHVADTVGSTQAGGIRTATWITMGMLGVGAIAVLCIIVSGGFRLMTPRVEEWQAGGPPAIQSPPLLARFRSSVSMEAQLEREAAAEAEVDAGRVRV